MGDYIVIAIIVVAVTCALIHIIRKKARGEMACGCGCSSCPAETACSSKKNIEN